MTDDIPTSDAPAYSSDGAAGRARIEPPQTKRLDALPVLYIVGFLILASALIYLWKHPSLPRAAALQAVHVDTMTQQIDTLAAQVKELQARAIPAPANLAPLEARLAALETRPAPPPAANLGPLEARIAALETRPAPPPTDLKPLDARIATLEAKPAPAPVDLKPLESRIAALEAKPPVDLAPLGARIDSAAKKEADDTAALGQRITQLDVAGKQTATALAALTDRAQLAGRLQAMSAALAAGQRLGDVPGAPPALARFAHDAPPTEAGLRLSFDKAAAAARDANLPTAGEDKPLLDRMWSRAQQSLTVRQGDHIIVGDEVNGVIERARQALDAGDLAGAVSALDRLIGPAKAAMSGWVGQAQSLLDARAAIGALAARG